MWYNGLNVTYGNFSILAKRFIPLIAELSGTEVYLGIIEDKKDEKIAFVNLEKKTIYVSNSLLNSSHKIYGSLAPQKALEVCGGVFVHEGAHIKFTPTNWLDVLLGKNKKNNVNISIANVVEDVAIESLAILSNPNFEILLTAANKNLFSDSLISQRRALWNGNKPVTQQDLDNAINLFIAWKRNDFPWSFNTDFERKLYETLQGAKNAQSVSTRKEVVDKIISMLRLDAGDCQDNKDSQDSQGQDSQDNKSSTFDIFGRKINLKEYKKVRVDKFYEGKEKFSFMGLKNGVSCFDVSNNKNNYPLTPVAFNSFSKIETGRASQRKVLGQPKTSGSRISNLRHYEEGKVFGNGIVDGGRSGLGKPEVLLLIDLSGSMRRVVEDGSQSKISFALKCAAGLSNAFIENGFQYAIYGHTVGWIPNSDLEYETSILDSVGIFKFKSFGEKANPLNSLKTMNRFFDGRGNCDSVAISYVSTLYPNSSNKKILIVISDGLPTERDKFALRQFGVTPAYDAISDTKNAVAVARKKDINVFSLAIDNEAVQSCNDIYGKNFNFYVTNQEQFVKAIIKYTE